MRSACRFCCPSLRSRMICVFALSILMLLAPATAGAEVIKLAAKVDGVSAEKGPSAPGEKTAFHFDSKTKVLFMDGNPITEGMVSFALDTESRTLNFEVADWVYEQMEEGAVAYIHGFAPVGWDAGIVVNVDLVAAKVGSIPFSETDVENIAAGLTYVSLHSPSLPGGTARGQIENLEEPSTEFPSEAKVTRGDGSCSAKLTVFGVLDEVELEMDKAQVTILRLPPGDSNGNGLRDMVLSADIEIGGGYAPGLGQINIEMLGSSKGIVESRQPESDFPADMWLYLHKRYVTPIGTFIGEEEPFKATDITQFPPFGAHLRPQVEKVKLMDEKTGKHVGYLHLGTVVQVSHIAPHEFPKNPLPPRVAPDNIPKFFKDGK